MKKQHFKIRKTIDKNEKYRYNEKNKYNIGEYMEHKINEKYKKLCQVFTPTKYVEQMLNWCNYSKNLYGKKVVENSFGEGNILIQIVKRYIEDCFDKSISKPKIQEGLNRDIYGYEIDERHYKTCIRRLNNLLEDYGMSKIQWDNINLEDALFTKRESFSFVIGNPPYIKYKSLEEKDRNYIREKFTTCKLGKFDYCYAFIQKSVDSLEKDGKMAYLVPSSIFKNVFAQEIRKYILPHLVAIYDYTTEKLFDANTNESNTTRLTTSFVKVLQKDINQDYIVYTDIVNQKTIKIKKQKLEQEKKWIFEAKNKEKKKEKFGDYFKISNTIATLYNKAYVILEENIIKEDKKYIYLKNGKQLEKQVVKVSASPKKMSRSIPIKERIIFTYDIKDGKIYRYSEKEFEKKYIFTCEYLKGFEEKLNNRKSDKSSKWYEYGRSQAIESIIKPKLLISTVITREVHPYILEEGTIPYSGIYIQATKEKTLEEAEEILKSEDFFEYIKNIGIHACGESYRITSKDISNYEF